MILAANENIHVFTKGIPEKISRHFMSTEFDCHCTYKSCKYTYINRQLVELLEDLRVYMNNEPLYITSGFRCRRYNKDIQGSPDSLHTYGLACDIAHKTKHPTEVYIYVADMNFPGIGRYAKHIHIDLGLPNRRWSK